MDSTRQVSDVFNLLDVSVGGREDRSYGKGRRDILNIHLLWDKQNCVEYLPIVMILETLNNHHTHTEKNGIFL